MVTCALPARGGSDVAETSSEPKLNLTEAYHRWCYWAQDHGIDV